MRNIVALVFDSRQSAHEALHELWRLDGKGEVKVHGAGVLGRDARGDIFVEAPAGNQISDAAIGLLIGALLGLLASPAAATAGAALGAATGGALGVSLDISTSGTAEQALKKSGMIVRPGQHALIADVDEKIYAPLDLHARLLGAMLYRRPESEIARDRWQELNPLFVPYDYDPIPTQEKI